MLTILTGLSGSGKTEAICRELRARMESGRELLLITPEQQSHRMERRVAAACGDGFSLCGEVLSFSRLYDRAAVEFGGLADPLPDRNGRLLLLALAQQELGDRLIRFGPRGRRLDFLPRLLRTTEELYAARLGAEELRAAAARAGGSLREKLSELALLLETAQAVTRQQLGDSRDRLARLGDCIAQTQVGSGGVWVDGFTDFTAAELQVLDGLLRRGTDLTVALTLGDGEEERFRIPEDTFQTLCRMAERRGAELCVRRLSDPPETPLRRLTENLYRWEAPPCPAADAPVELYAMSSFGAECRLAAGRIRALLRADGSLRLRDIALAVPDFAARRGAVTAALAEYGLPCYVEERLPLTEQAAVRFLLSALRCVTQGWRRADLFGALKTGFGGLAPEALDRLENYCLVWSLEGEGSWRREADWDLPLRGYEREAEGDQARLAELNGLRQQVAAPFGALADGLREPKPVRQQLLALWRFLTDTGLADTLQALADAREADGDAAGAQECLGVWNAISDSLTQMDTVLGRTVLAGEEFARMLELLLSAGELGSIPAALDCLSLGSPARLRGRKPRVLLVLGADEQSLPEQPGENGLFSRQERRSLFQLGLQLSGEGDEALCRPLLDCYLLLSEARERLILSYTTGEGQRPGLPIRQAERLLGLRTADEAVLQGEYLTEAAEPCLLLAMSGKGPWAAAAQAALPERRQALLNAAVRQRGHLSPETVNALYGAPLRLTPSRAESFFHCAGAYFYQYGLRARERKPARFDAPVLGTFIHYLLEQVCQAVQAGKGFAHTDEGELLALTESAAAAFQAGRLREKQRSDPRFRYLFRRYLALGQAVVLDVAAELAAGAFAPLAFELEFGGRDETALPPVRVGDVWLQGTVDRVDGWRQGDDLYLCVEDYKTGTKDFRFADLWYGLSTQMLLYLHMLRGQGSRFGGRVIPAGVLYTPARDLLPELPRNATAEEIGLEKARLRRRKGVLLADPALLQARERGLTPRFLPVKYKDGSPVSGVVTAAELDSLLALSLRRLEDMSRSLREGLVAPAPLWRGKEQGPCVWCPYGSVCGFDPSREQPRQARSMKDQEFWEKVREEEQRGHI